VPVVAIVDTNADPSDVQYPIPANDDAVKALQLIVDYVQAAISTGKAKAKTATPTADKDEKSEKIEKVKV
jgi:small subunit ribosomal protein S2